MRGSLSSVARSAVALGAVLVAGVMTPAATLATGDEVRSISAGQNDACAVRTDGSAWCWGYDYYGQLGDGTTGDAQNLRLVPVRVRQGTGDLTGVRAVSAGDDTSCAVKTNGTVWCWGSGHYGVGDGTTDDHHQAVKVRSTLGYLTGMIAVSAGGGDSACALRDDRTVWCWGRAAEGEVGDGTTGDAQGNRLSAVQVRRGNGFLTAITAISTGIGYHSCARRSDGTAWCWGYDDHGQLGDGTRGDANNSRLEAVKVKQASGPMTGVRSVSAGDQHSCAVKTDGTVWCWGDDRNGALGDGTTGDPTTHDRLSPVKVKRGSGYLTDITAVSGGGDGRDHTCARRSDGTAWCWGYDLYGQLGDGTTGNVDNVRTKAVKVLRGTGYLSDVRSVDIGQSHSCAVRTNGTAWCWGTDVNGQLGNGTYNSDPHPKAIHVVFP